MSNFCAVTNRLCLVSSFFFFNDTATTEIYTLSLHDALPISTAKSAASGNSALNIGSMIASLPSFKASKSKILVDRKSTRLNSSHSQISYAVFCLKKKKNNQLSHDTRH